MTAAKKEPRQSKTPHQRAFETVKVLERRLERIEAAKTKLNAELKIVQADLEATTTRLAYARQNPDLQAVAGEPVP